jgi:membrane fusion protein (multidrug efflux system)
MLIGALGVAVIAAAVFGIPWIRFVLSTVSTDDAFVNGHVTSVAPRVHGQVARVLVDDNNRVHKGDLLVELDKEPLRDAVAVKKAAVDTAGADLQVARATVRGIEAQAWSRRWQLQQAVENVENQISLLHARVAALRKAKATLILAQQEFDRTSQLVVSETASRELYDQRQATLSIARAVMKQRSARRCRECSGQGPSGARTCS